jgi:protein-tyrosine phosphatase
VTSVRPVFETVFNFRDLGGYRSEDGRTVAYRRLFRSDSLHRITMDEGRQLADLGVRTVLDLRRPIEIERDGRITVELGLAYHNIHPLHRPWDPGLYDESTGAHRYLADRYLDMAEEGRAGLGEALRLIADPECSPLVMHCFAGKDRTGVLSALTLSLLGVHEQEIALDYALSATAQHSLTQLMRAEAVGPFKELPTHILACPPQAMLLFLAGLHERYGSVRAYAAQAGVSDGHVAALRAHLLVN